MEAIDIAALRARLDARLATADATIPALSRGLKEWQHCRARLTEFGKLLATVEDGTLPSSVLSTVDTERLLPSVE